MQPPTKTKITTTLGAAQHAVRQSTQIRVFLSGSPIDPWDLDDVLELLADAQADGEIYWEAPPPELNLAGFDLVCHAGDSLYRVEIPTTAGLGE